MGIWNHWWKLLRIFLVQDFRPWTLLMFQCVLCWYRSLWLGSTEMESYSCSIPTSSFFSLLCHLLFFPKMFGNIQVDSKVFDKVCLKMKPYGLIINLYIKPISLIYRLPLRVFSLASWGWDPTYHVYRQGVAPRDVVGFPLQNGLQTGRLGHPWN